jgi:hypothetical protein
VTRNEVLLSVIGKPWAANARGPEAFDCFHLMAHVQRVLAGRGFDDIEVPDDPSWSWMIEAIETHPDRQRWREVPASAMGLVRARDLSVVLMARRTNPAHVGVWLKPEAAVIHADQDHGVICDPLADLRTKGWQRLRFYEPMHDQG